MAILKMNIDVARLSDYLKANKLTDAVSAQALQDYYKLYTTERPVRAWMSNFVNDDEPIQRLLYQTPDGAWRLLRWPTGAFGDFQQMSDEPASSFIHPIMSHHNAGDAQ